MQYFRICHIPPTMATREATPPTTEPATVALSDALSPLLAILIDPEDEFALFDIDGCYRNGE